MRWFPGLTLLFGLAAAGQAQEITGGYVGLSLGSLSYKEKDDFGFVISDSTASYRILGGYHFNSYYALEAGWGATGGVTETFRGFDSLGNPASLEFETEQEIATLRLLMFAPFDALGVFGGIGYYDATLETTVTFETPVEVQRMSTKDGDDGAMVVGGIVFELRRIAIRGEYEWFDTSGDVDTTNLGVTVLFRF